MGLLNPANVVTDAMSLTHANAVLFLELVKSAIRFSANSAYRIPVQLGLIVILAIAGTKSAIASSFSGVFCHPGSAHGQAATSLDSVPAIVFVSSKYQMIRVDAGRRVTGMPDNQPVRYWPVEQNIGYSGVVPRPSILNKLDGGIVFAAGLLPDPTSGFGNDVVAMKSRNKVFNFHNSMIHRLTESNDTATLDGRKV